MKNERLSVLALQGEGVCLAGGRAKAELGCFGTAEDYRRFLRPLPGPIVGV